MRSHRNARHAGIAHSRTGAVPMSLLCARLGEEFELFSDRTDEAMECEALVNELAAVHHREIADDDAR